MGRGSFDFGLAPGFGDRLKESRIKAGLKQRELAFAGCTAAYLSRLENGERTPSLQMLEELARRLRVSRNWLLTGHSDEAIWGRDAGTGCTLCGYPLTERSRHYAEGDFCDDVAGCRRRALSRQAALEGTLNIFRDAITDIVPADFRTDDVALASLFPPEVVALLKISTDEGDENGSTV